MVRTRLGILLVFATVLSPLLLPSTPALAGPGSRWAVSLGGGLVGPFTYRSLSYSSGSTDEFFMSSGLAVAGVSRRLSNHAFLRADLGYLGYRKDLPILVPARPSGIAGLWPSGSVLTAQMPFVGAGVRLYAAGPGATKPRLYVDALPTLWVARWREKVETPQHSDLQGNYYPARVEQDAFATLEAGFVTGIGLLAPLAGHTKLDLGVRYLFSTGAGRRTLGQYSSGEFDGLRQLALVMSIHRQF